jgi:hypothetical protein
MTTLKKYRIELFDQFFKAVEAVKVIPEEIRVRKEELCCFLERLAGEFGIKVRIVKNLRAVDDVRRHMEKSFGKQR